MNQGARIYINFTIFSVLSNAIRNTIQRLLQESRSFNRNDVLVHISDSNSRLHFSNEHSFLIEDFPKAILSENRKAFRESGVNTLCKANGYLLWTVNDEVQRSPILLTPLKVSLDRIRGEVRFDAIEAAQFVNPYIEYFIHEKGIKTENLSPENVTEILIQSGFDIDLDSKPCIGNFHHHRYAVLRELEILLESENFSAPLQLLLGETKPDFNKIALPRDLLLSADTDHEAVFESFSAEPTVIQGPPGTGKSQVLTNLLGKLLASEKSSVVFSEKRVALEVLLQKLRNFELDKLGFIVTSDDASKNLLRQLEENWIFFEQADIPPAVNLRLSEQTEAQLQFSLDVLNQPEVIGGLSLYDFRKWMMALRKKSNAFVSNPPLIPQVMENADTIQMVFDKNLNQVVPFLQPSALEQDDFESTSDRLKKWATALSELNDQVSFSTLSDLRYVMKQAALCQIKENHRNKPYQALYKRNSRKQQRFFKLCKDWNVVLSETELHPGSTIKWIVEPTKSDVSKLQQLSEKTSFLSQRKFARLWSQFSDLHHSLAADRLALWEEYLKLRHKKSQLVVDFCELGIQNPEKELEILRSSIESFTNSSWEVLEELSPKQADFLAESHEFLHSAHSELRQLLSLDDTSNILETLNTLNANFSEIIALRHLLKELDTAALNLLKSAEDYDDYLAIVANSHWSAFRERFPAFSEFQMQDLHTKAETIIKQQSEEAKLFAQSILHGVQTKFRKFHQLLNTPARKLSEDEKALKKRLRKGKSILVKEFAKTRSHPSIRELFASEAREWIQLLTPLWFSNPTQISKVFPMEEGLFDVAIFDEASQILLQNGLGALQRAKQGVIAGDSQQMGPTSYFKAGNNDNVDLLHQASFYWKTCSLKHHYRSLHPDLIAFSNKYIYENKLTAYQAHGINSPLKFHFTKNGCFEERRNLNEAKQVAVHLEKHLTSRDTIGVVAFSEEQLNCIQRQLSDKTIKELNERQENGTAFFKSLENVQGDECDHLIISFGYARDNSGEFAMRFGPMNTENGRRRLNVLLTRARKQLHFFASVTSGDFKLSKNESVNLLRLWFAFLEAKTAHSDEISLPLNTLYEANGKTLTLIEPNKELYSAREFVTFQKVMETRGWALSYR